MILYPHIELQNSRCVSLSRGRIEEPAIWHVDPLAKAKEFAQAGAEWMSVTDFDAVGGKDTNHELVLKIIRHAGIPVQLGGGFRSRDRVEEWIDLGAGRIVIGTLAAQNPMIVRDLAQRHADQIVLAVDVWHGKVMVEGWRTTSAYDPVGFVEAYAGTPFAAIVVTDIHADIADTDASLAMISKIAEIAKVPVIASGIVRTVDDIARLKYVRNIAGVIVGRALYNKTISLSEALDIAKPDRGQVAQFI